MIGIDLIKIDRMARLMDKYGHKALQRFLSDEEILLIRSPRNAAGFWAAKEAFSKALGTGIGSQCGFHDITLSKTDRGAPKLTFSDKFKEEFNIKEAALSITHDGDYAIAVVTLNQGLL